MVVDDDQSAPSLSIYLNEEDKDATVTINDRLRCTGSGDKLWAGGRATHGIRGSGKYYFEAMVLGDKNSSGICRFGWSTMAAHHELGKDAHGFGYGGTGMKSLNNTFEPYGKKFGPGDTVGCYIDLDDNTISFSVNGVQHGTAFEIPQSLRSSVFFPAYVLKGSTAEFNFGSLTSRPSSSSSSSSSAFTYPPRAGFKSLYEAAFPNLVTSNDKEAFVSTERKPLAIILEPSRELAEQIYKDLEDLSRYVITPELRKVLLVGGDDVKRQQKALARGVDIVVGTLGRVFELHKAKILDLSQVRFFILDEADRMTDKDNLDMVLRLYAACPGGGGGENRLQVCFFSATLHSNDITALANKICHNPTWVDLKGIDSVPECVHHVIYRVVPDEDYDTYVVNAGTKSITDGVHMAKNPAQEKCDVDKKSFQIKEIKQQVLLKIVDKFKMSQCIIFCRTNVDCDNLETFLCTHGGGKKFTESMESGREHPYSCCVLAGMRNIETRRRNLEAFRNGNVRFLICTDVAARGIDIKALPYCINMTLPDEAENYIHRIGRVGRAECMGLAISIVCDSEKEKVWYHQCANRGKGCTNRNLKADGGCTIWYNEGDLLAQIERRLQVESIPSLLPQSFDLPPALAELGVEYGEKIEVSSNGRGVGDWTGDTTIKSHIEALKPSLRELAALEVEAQNNFLALHVKFGVL